jgi:hypothetical protein
VLFSMLRRDTLVIAVFPSLPEKRRASEFVLPKGCAPLAFQANYFLTR